MVYIHGPKYNPTSTKLYSGNAMQLFPNSPVTDTSCLKNPSVALMYIGSTRWLLGSTSLFFGLEFDPLGTERILD